MLVADVSLIGSWENALAQIERHTLDPETFMASIRDYTRKATGEILKLSRPHVHLSQMQDGPCHPPGQDGKMRQ